MSNIIIDAPAQASSSAAGKWAVSFALLWEEGADFFLLARLERFVRCEFFCHVGEH